MGTLVYISQLTSGLGQAVAFQQGPAIGFSLLELNPELLWDGSSRSSRAQSRLQLRCPHSPATATELLALNKVPSSPPPKLGVPAGAELAPTTTDDPGSFAGFPDEPCCCR